ncbi:MAG: glycosyltransferase [Bacilli bacterium]|nr:glycosyltransferase [Bacilli bacterium]
MAIPKKIHYVWVGGKEKPNDIKRCMKTWKKHLKDYEIIEWNESNFDIDSHPFTKSAYKAKKWAYVSDYIRAYALYNEGGIYLDTDILVLDDLKKFLGDRAFVGFENPDYPFTACFGAEAKHPLLKDIIDYYNGKEFQFDTNDQMKSVNTKIVSEILIKNYNCKVNNKEQLLKEGIRVYPDNILCNPSNESSTIHIFTGTWMEGMKPIARKINKFIKLRLTSKTKAKLYNKYIRKNK